MKIIQLPLKPYHMHDISSYPGKELLLFEKAVKWKRYFSSFIRPHIGSEVLEAGAGIGANTILLYRDTIQKWILLEPDTAMASLLEKKIAAHELPTRCQVFCGTVSRLEKNQQFDTIIYIDVLEHIEDDKEEMESAARLLKPGGRLIILAPAFRFLYSPFDKAIGHYRRYSKPTLKKVIPSSLKKDSIRYIDSTGFLMSLANRMFLKQEYPTQKQVNFWDRFAVPVSIIVDRILFFSFGKTILGVWKKEEHLP